MEKATKVQMYDIKECNRKFEKAGTIVIEGLAGDYDKYESSVDTAKLDRIVKHRMCRRHRRHFNYKLNLVVVL